MYTVAGYFGGIGGALLGASWAGMFPIYNYEPRSFFNRETFKANFPGVPMGGDKPYLLARHKPAILIGSPDCKQFSNLGTKRKDKGKLKELPWNGFDYAKFLLAVLEYEPELFILENVPNILKSFWVEGNTLFFYGEPVLTLSGYHIQTIKLNSFDFGVAQKRNRVFLIGAKRFQPNFDYLKLCKNQDFVQRLKEHYMGNNVQEAFFQGLNNQINHNMPNHTPKRIEGFSRLKPGESYYGGQNNRRLFLDKPSGTVASHCSRFVHPTEPRVLTVREAARLMGFPDNFIFHGTESEQLDQVGKSIVPQVAMGICSYLKEALLDVSDSR